jgi:hypothetical protein
MKVWLMIGYLGSPSIEGRSTWRDGPAERER